MTSGLEIRILYTEHFYPGEYKPNDIKGNRRHAKGDPVLE
jgi:hypothetical protein